MAEEISWEVREDAFNYYVTDGKTYEQVSQLTGVSLSQLKRWGQTEGWADAKREYREALTSIRRDTVKLRAGLLKKALDSKEPQDVYAFAAIERVEAARKSGIVVEPSTPPVLDNFKNIKTPQEAVDALQEVVELKLNRLLASPDEIKLSEVNEIKKSIELVEQMRSKYRQDNSTENRSLDAESIRNIREQLKL